MKTMFKRLIALLLLVSICTLSLASCKKNKGMVYVSIEVKDYGTIIVELDQKNAPVTVKNFVKLVESGFYNGLTFHRVMENFMIQGGDPNADGTGGSAQKIKGEFKANGFENGIKHERGVISMARRGDSYNSASSQFFICNATNRSVSSLDGQYAAFGRVVEGMNVVDAITQDFAIYNGVIGNKLVQPVITEMKVIDYKK